MRSCLSRARKTVRCIAVKSNFKYWATWICQKIQQTHGYGIHCFRESCKGFLYRRRLIRFEHNATFKGIHTVLRTLTLHTQTISLFTLGCFIADAICDLQICSQGVLQAIIHGKCSGERSMVHRKPCFVDRGVTNVLEEFNGS